MVVVELERGRVVHHAQEGRPDRADGLLPGPIHLEFFYTRMYPGLIMTNVRSLAWDRDVPLEHPEPEGDQGADRQAA